MPSKIFGSSGENYRGNKMKYGFVEGSEVKLYNKRRSRPPRAVEPMMMMMKSNKYWSRKGTFVLTF